MNLSKTFRYYSDSNKFCDITTHCSEENFNNDVYYLIKISYKYHDNVPKNIDHQESPFYNKNLKREIYGEFVYKNSLTQKMVELLFMDDIELSKITGNTTPIAYKINLIINLGNLG